MCAMSGAPATILLVDDDDDFRYATECVLRAAGFVVIAVAGFAPALQQLDREDHIDLLLTDIQMPGGIHGLALGRMALMRQPKLKIIYLTGFTFGDAIREASGPILAKPVPSDRLLAAVAQQLAQRDQAEALKLA